MTTRWSVKSLTLTLLLLLPVAPAFAQAPPDIYFNNFEFPDMRTCTPGSPDDGTCINSQGTIGTIPMANGENPNPPANGGFCLGTAGSGVCTGADGFTSARTGGLFNIVNDPANCHSGSWCGRGDWPAGSMPPSDQIRQSGRLVNGAPQGCTAFNGSVCVSHALYYMTWLKFASNFALVPGDPSVIQQCAGKLLYIRSFTDHGGTGSTAIIRYQTNAGAPPFQIGYEYFPLNNPANGVSANVFTFTPDNIWHSFEAHIDANTGRYQMWFDGTLMWDVTAPNESPLTAIDNNTWGVYVNQNVGADQCTVVNTTQFWVDDVAVSTQRIGAAGTPPPPPADPNTLTVTKLLYDWFLKWFPWAQKLGIAFV